MENEKNQRDIFVGPDIIRIIVALLIIAYHCSLHIPNINISANYIVRLWIRNGAAGVTMLFVLSGFMQAITLMRTHTSYLKYIVKRLIRIVPLYYFMLGVGYIYYDYQIPTNAMLGGLFFTPDTRVFGSFPMVGPLWFVGVIIRLYIVTPLLVYVGKKSMYYLILLCGAAVVVKYLNYHFFITEIDTYYLTFLGRFDQYVFGILIAIIGVSTHVRYLYSNMLKTIAPILVLSAYFVLKVTYTGVNFDALRIFIIYLSIEAVLFGVLIQGLSSLSLPKILTQLIHQMSKITYAMYIFNMSIIILVNTLYPDISHTYSGITIIAIVCLFTAGASWGAHRLIEVPLQRFLRFYTDRLMGEGIKI